MTTTDYKGLTIVHRRGVAIVLFGGKEYTFKTLQQAKDFITEVVA